jgi:uncharacterized protein
LLAEHGMPHTRIGAHRGANTAAKALGLVSRSTALMIYARNKRFDVAFSHNSNDLAAAAWAMGIPHLVVHDYEHANLSYAINARLATRILVPECIPAASIIAHGARPEKVGHFPGLKENVYLGRSTPWSDLRQEFGAGPDDVLAVLRAPATMSAYHRFGNELFSAVVQRIGATPNVRAVLLPRTPQQAEEMRPMTPSNTIIPDRVYDAPSLIRSADLVLSAGGTMNREAAVLGTPAYTVFAGAMGAVDEDLIRRGLVVEVAAPEDVALVRKTEGEGLIYDNRQVILDELRRLAGG